MSTTTVDFNGLENDDWTPQMGPTINPVNAGDIRAMHLDGALEVIISGPAWGGAIVTRKLPLIIPPVPVLYVGFDYTMIFTKESLALERNAEMDLKICLKKAAALIAPATIGELTIADLSGQLCLYKGGMFQIDVIDPVKNLATWTDTGFAVGTPPPETPLPVEHRYKVDTIAKRSSVTGIRWNGGTPYVMPANLQNQSFLYDTWDPVIAAQIQPDENALAGGFITKFDCIRVRVSAQPIPWAA